MRNKNGKDSMKNDEFPAFSVLMSVYKKEEPAFLDQAFFSNFEDLVIRTSNYISWFNSDIIRTSV